MPGRLSELAFVVGPELRAPEADRVGRGDEVVPEVGVAGLGERPVLTFELPGLMAPPRQAGELGKLLLGGERPTSPTSATIPAVNTCPMPGMVSSVVRGAAASSTPIARSRGLSPLRLRIVCSDELSTRLTGSMRFLPSR
jgi:hypothetical protein